MRYDLEQRELMPKRNDSARLTRKPVVVKPLARRPFWLTLGMQCAAFSLILLSLFAMRAADTSFTRTVLDAVSQVAGVDGGGRAGTDGRIRFVGGVFSERKCILQAPFSAFSFDASGANLKLVGLTTALRPCAAGTVDEIGTLGELNYVDVRHEDGVTTRYLTSSRILTAAGAAVTRETVLAAKDMYEPVILNVFVDGRQVTNITVNRDLAIECIL